MLINTLFYINLLCYNYSEYLALFQNLTIPQGARWEQHPAKTRPWVPGAAPFTLFINEPAAVAKEMGGNIHFGKQRRLLFSQPSSHYLSKTVISSHLHG